MSQNYTEEQIQAMIEKIRKIKPEEATRERAIKILNMLPEVAGDITKALEELVKESEKKPTN
ncbi:MAG: hypothetical protein Q7K55_02460 [Candidatus Levybacteria bacterium]|nr:hypothetical protein [Candidatus Levybacteria bacterium]